MQKQLAQGLILRSLSEGHASDRERLPDFYASINTAGESDQVKEGLRIWTRDLMEGHPNVTGDDIFVVVDPARDDMLVSATLLIPQTWRYEEILLPVGRPELVATHPEYRSRGLVRTLFEVVHERSAALGHLVQGITGIPHFYRQFGYTMAVELDQHAIFQLSALRERPPEQQPAFTLRPATPDDAPAILEWMDYAARGRLLSDLFSLEVMQREIAGRRPGYSPRTVVLVIVDAQGRDVGCVALLDALAEPHELRCPLYVVGERSSYLATFPDVMRGIKAWAQAYFGRCPEMLAFGAGIHETLDCLIDHSPGGLIRRREYAWYLRVPDPVRFLREITPVLERRLDGSGAHRYTGELRVSFADLSGLSLRFEEGRLHSVEAVRGKDGYDAEFPWLLFWDLVFGYRALEPLIEAVPDIWANAKASALLPILFPRKKSFLLGLS